jgi:FecR-like protein
MWRPAGCIITASLLLVGGTGNAASPSRDEARVTTVIRDVKLLPSGAKSKPAALDDMVNAGTGVRTGDRSRSELTFVDLTIERLGANTLFNLGKAGRHVELESGSMLLRVPKDSGGAQMTTRAVTVGITGTTVILETGNRNKLFVLEGGARISLNKYPRESVIVHGGQMEDVPPGATKLPPPVNIDLNDLMKKHPLITDFPPLPSQNLINATANNPPPPVTGQPVGPGPGIIVPIVGNILGSGVGIGPISTGGGGHHSGRQSGKRGVKTPGSEKTGTKPTKGTGTHPNNTDSAPHSSVPKASPSPTPRRKHKPN